MMVSLTFGANLHETCPGPDETVAVPGCGGTAPAFGIGCGGSAAVPGYPAIQLSPGLVKKKSYFNKV